MSLKPDEIEKIGRKEDRIDRNQTTKEICRATLEIPCRQLIKRSQTDFRLDCVGKERLVKVAKDGQKKQSKSQN